MMGGNISRDSAFRIALLREMVVIRRFEEKAAEMYGLGKIRGYLHLYIGEEAVAVGLMKALETHDSVVSTYREHGHALAKGIHPKNVMAEMYGKIDGCSRGRGGSMHLFDAKTSFYGGNAIVAGGIPVAVGLALSYKMRGEKKIATCIFGEGAMAEGDFHESMNLAALWRLPVLFVCENNLYAMGTRLDRSQSQTNPCERAKSYGVSAESVDGMDVEACYQAAFGAVQAVRSGEGPFFLEFKTYRFRPHSMFDPELYREKQEVEEWKKRCPIACFKARLLEDKVMSVDALSQMEKEAAIEIDAAVLFAEKSPWEPIEDLTKYVYAEGENGG